jgi:uncharacterized protein YceH (UPF0502 family)
MGFEEFSLKVELSPIEARVLGSLIEKSVATPDQYPLTLNALTNACNQKSSRDPVMSLEPGSVQHTLRQLEAQHLVSSKEDFRGRAERYTQRFCNTPFSELQLSPAELAIVCVLLLRGPATPGELRTRCASLHEFADNDAVATTLQAMIDRQGGAIVARLPRAAGRRDHEYMHLFGGAIDSVPEDAPRAEATPRESKPDRIDQLEARLARVEHELAELKARLGGE